MATLELVLSEFIVLAVVIFFLLRYYQGNMVTLDVSITVYLSWVLGFVGILLLPYDISMSLVNSEHNPILLDVWKFVYWSTFLLAWVVLPIQNEFHNSGHFTACEKFGDAMKRLFLAGTVCATAAILYIIIMVATKKGSPSEVVGFMMAMGNTYGVFIIIILMGSGLVAVPRRLWQLSDYFAELQRLYVSAINVEAKYQEARYELEDCEHDVTVAANALERSSDQELKACVDILKLEVSNFNFAYRSSSRKHAKNLSQPNNNDLLSGSGGRVNAVGSNGTSLDCKSGLVELHGRLIQAQIRLRGADRRWRVLLKKCKRVEELVHGRGAPENSDPKWADMKTEMSLDRGKSKWDCSCCGSWEGFKGALYSFWMTVFHKHVCRVLSVICAILSALILWSEMVMSTKLHSPIGELMGAYHPREQDGQTNDAEAIFVQAISFLALMYMSICMYWSLFRLNLGWAFTLQGPQQSPPAALIFNGEYFSRLQFPLGFNFLMTLNVPKTDITAFSALMSNIHIVPVFGTSFQVYVPLFMILVALMSLFNVFTRILSLFGIESDDTVGANYCGFCSFREDEEESTQFLPSGTENGGKKTNAKSIVSKKSLKLSEGDQEKYDMGKKLVCTELRQMAISRVHTGKSVISGPKYGQKESSEYDGVPTSSNSNAEDEVEDIKGEASKTYRSVFFPSSGKTLDEEADDVDDLEVGPSSGKIGNAQLSTSGATFGAKATRASSSGQEKQHSSRQSLEIDNADGDELEFDFARYLEGAVASDDEEEAKGSSATVSIRGERKPSPPSVSSSRSTPSIHSSDSRFGMFFGGITSKLGLTGDNRSGEIANENPRNSSHGTTGSINKVLEGSGARTGVVNPLHSSVAIEKQPALDIDRFPSNTSKPAAKLEAASSSSLQSRRAPAFNWEDDEDEDSNSYGGRYGNL